MTVVDGMVVNLGEQQELLQAERLYNLSNSAQLLLTEAQSGAARFPEATWHDGFLHIPRSGDSLATRMSSYNRSYIRIGNDAEGAVVIDEVHPDPGNPHPPLDGLTNFFQVGKAIVISNEFGRAPRIDVSYSKVAVERWETNEDDARQRQIVHRFERTQIDGHPLEAAELPRWQELCDGLRQEGYQNAERQKELHNHRPLLPRVLGWFVTGVWSN
jgi:hypothetical protein